MTSTNYQVYYGPNYGSNKIKEKKYKSCDIIKSNLLLIDYYDILKVDELQASQCRFRLLTNVIDTDTNMIQVSLQINNKNYESYCNIPLNELKHKNIIDFKQNNLVTVNLGLNELVINNSKVKKYLILDIELTEKSLKRLQKQLED